MNREIEYRIKKDGEFYMFANLMLGYEIVEIEEEEVWGLNIKDYNGDWNVLSQTFSTKQEAIIELKNRIDCDYNNAEGHVYFDMYPTIKPEEGTYLYLDGKKKKEDIVNNDVNDPLWYLYRSITIPGVIPTSKSNYHGKGWSTERQAWNAMRGNILLNIKVVNTEITRLKIMNSNNNSNTKIDFDKSIEGRQDYVEQLQERLEFINNTISKLL